MLFDAYIFVDWSASSTPKRGRDSIWVADGWLAGDGVENLAVENPPTRREAEVFIGERLRLHGAAGRRVLVGVDFPLGYPQGAVARMLPANGVPWRTLWRHLAATVEDGPRNQNNRFEVATALNRAAGERWYWGCPPRRSAEMLSPTKAGCRAEPELRLVEKKLRASHRRPFAVWQLLGNGSVGSQALLGLPVCERLRNSVSAAVWPFETGLRCPAAEHRVVLCEIWPGAIVVASDAHPVRDAAQMISYVRATAARDASGNLAEWFEVPGLSEDERKTAEAEGWVLGFVPGATASMQERPAARSPSRTPRTAPT